MAKNRKSKPHFSNSATKSGRLYFCPPSIKDDEPNVESAQTPDLQSLASEVATLSKFTLFGIMKHRASSVSNMFADGPFLANRWSKIDIITANATTAEGNNPAFGNKIGDMGGAFVNMVRTCNVVDGVTIDGAIGSEPSNHVVIPKAMQSSICTNIVCENDVIKESGSVVCPNLVMVSLAHRVVAVPSTQVAINTTHVSVPSAAIKPAAPWHSEIPAISEWSLTSKDTKMGNKFPGSPVVVNVGNNGSAESWTRSLS